MLQTTWESNRQSRIYQVTKLFSQICVERPIRIDVNKVSEPIRSTNLAWILAIIRKGYNCFGEIDFLDPGLCAMAKNMVNAPLKALEDGGKLVSLGVPKCDDEPNFLFQSYKKTFNYKLPRDIVISILAEQAVFGQCLVESLKEDRKQNADEKSNVVNQAAISVNIVNLNHTVNHVDESLTNIYQYQTSITNNQAQGATSVPLGDVRSNGESKISAGSYRKDPVSNAVINHVLPVILPNKNEQLPRDKYWECFMKLKDALIKDEAVNVEIFVEKNKDNSTIAGTDRNQGVIDVSFKAFRGRLPTLITAYINKS